MRKLQSQTAIDAALLDSLEVVSFNGQLIPVLGVANATGNSLPAARETAKRIESFIRIRMRKQGKGAA